MFLIPFLAAYRNYGMNETLKLLFPHHFYITHIQYIFTYSHHIPLCFRFAWFDIYYAFLSTKREGKKEKEKEKMFRNIAPLILQQYTTYKNQALAFCQYGQTSVLFIANCNITFLSRLCMSIVCIVYCYLSNTLTIVNTKNDYDTCTFKFCHSARYMLFIAQSTLYVTLV